MENTPELRLLGAALVLIFGLVGSVAPSVYKFRESSTTSHLLRATAGGVILALSLIHIFPDAVEDLGQVGETWTTPYNAAGACGVAGVLIMIILESIAHQFLHRSKSSSSGRDGCDHQQSNGSHSQQIRGYLGERHDSADLSGRSSYDSCFKPACGSYDTVALPGDLKESLLIPAVASYKAVTEAERRRQRQQGTKVVSAMLFEAGCVFHSVIIGAALGVNDQDASTVWPLVAALCCHQLLEGVALGTFVSHAGLSKFKGLFMAVVYSLTCPLGTVLGVVFSGSYDPDSTQAKAIQGALNGISSGMLLYIALFQLIPEDGHVGCVMHAHGRSQDLSQDHHDVEDTCASDDMCVLLPDCNHRSGSKHGNTSRHAGDTDSTCAQQSTARDEKPRWYPAARIACLVLGAGGMAILGVWA